MTDVADLQFLFSGTDGKTGGAIGSNRIYSQTGTGITTLTGVSIVDAAGNSEGSGTLTYTNTGKTLKWTPPGGTVGTAVALTADGNYAIQGSDGETLNVSVTYASLPGANISNTITIANSTQNIFDDLTTAETTDGVSRYRCVYAKNAGAGSLADMLLYIFSNTPGQDTVLIGLDPAGKNGTAATIANENTAPAGVTFTSPSEIANALSIGTLATGDYYPFWIKNLVPSGCDTATTANTFVLSGTVTF